MHIIFRVLLIIAILTIAIYCQGGGGSRSGSRSRSSRSTRTSRSFSSYLSSRNCTDGTCQRQNTFIGYTTAGSALIIFGIACYQIWWHGKPAHSNSTYIDLPSNEVELQESNQFVSGLWSCEYYQYNIWYAPNHFSLVFDSETQKVTGNGSDSVGEYTIEGIYSSRTNRMGLIKTYQKGTGNPIQNLGHDVTIQVVLNSIQHQFEGTWYVRTSKYTGQDKFQLKLGKNYKKME
ncbi:unnamed protein product [Adineta steineri]|uniref:Uncharacterized protein n=1 Tax=Adineta steineri TaxID=433720 RepID=A0A819LQS8_9BILA|nr:unnamed protein product [Adineta steineri]